MEEPVMLEDPTPEIRKTSLRRKHSRTNSRK